MARISSTILATVVVSLTRIVLTHAHMQMSWPYPLRSPLDPTLSWDVKDYSMTNPLNANGSDFPCKHYQEDGNTPQAVKATYTAGETYNLTLSGYATHDGGSCQISLSYDNGVSFKVIKSIIGGCPLSPTYDFTIPASVPSSDSVLLSWSWFNLVGNREMYQNCARVSVQSRNTSRTVRSRRQAGFEGLPDMYVCNVNNGCTTVEGENVVFPKPGSDVTYG